MTAPVPTTPRIAFPGRILIVGCGAVSRCLQPLLLRHLDMDSGRITVIDIDDVSDLIPDTIAAGVTFRQFEITPESFATDALTEFVGDGDLLINLAWNIDAGDIIGWCQDHGVMYLDTSVEEWDPYREVERPQERTLYHRHMALREQAASWPANGPTAVVEHGANPGLVVALGEAGAGRDRDRDPRRRGRRDRRRSPRPARPTRSPTATSRRSAMETGTKVIHISERDTQISSDPKQAGEFVNTWSVDGFYEEGVAPAELGWGTHEDWLPEHGFTHTRRPREPDLHRQAGHRHARAVVGADDRPDHRHGRAPRRGVHDQRRT